jgi:hypothetical protein
MTMYMTKVWRFPTPAGPLQFGKQGWRENARRKLKDGDLVAIVATHGHPSPPEKQGRLLGLVEPTRECCSTLDYGMDDPSIAIPEDFKDGRLRLPYGLIIRRACLFPEPPLFTEISSRKFSMDSAAGIVPLSADEVSRIERLANEDIPLRQNVRERARLEGWDEARRRGAIPTSTRRGVMHMRQAPAQTYLMEIEGARDTYKIGWAFDAKARAREFNKTSLPALGGLRYTLKRFDSWDTAREAFKMEQALLRKFDRVCHRLNREVLVNVELAALEEAWHEYINAERPRARYATSRRWHFNGSSTNTTRPR